MNFEGDDYNDYAALFPDSEDNSSAWIFPPPANRTLLLDWYRMHHNSTSTNTTQTTTDRTGKQPYQVYATRRGDPLALTALVGDLIDADYSSVGGGDITLDCILCSLGKTDSDDYRRYKWDSKNTNACNNCMCRLTCLRDRLTYTGQIPTLRTSLHSLTHILVQISTAITIFAFLSFQ